MQSAARVERILQHELDKGIPPSKIVMAGFSQGGALALHVALRSKVSFGGCVALSTWIPLRDDYPTAMSQESRSLPVLQVHGDSDPVVGFEWGKRSHELLKSLISTPSPKFMTIPVSIFVK